MKLRRQHRKTRKEIAMNEKQQRDAIKEQDVGLTRLLMSPEGAVLRTEEIETVNVEEKLAAAKKARQANSTSLDTPANAEPAGHIMRIKHAEKIAEAELAAEEELSAALRKENEKEKEVSHEQATEGR